MLFRSLLPGAHVLEDCYGRNVIALAVRKGEAGWCAHVSAFVNEAKANGLVGRAISSAGLRGVDPV
mgnify:CR=1 FL=1